VRSPQVDEARIGRWLRLDRRGAQGAEWGRYLKERARMKRLLGLVRSLLIYHNPATLRAWRRLYADLLGPGDIAIDVGAHVGTRTRAMRAAGARVVALEPQRLFARFLRFTLPADVILIEAAAGSRDGVGEMAVSSRHPTVSSLRRDFVADAATTPGFDHVQWDTSEAVTMVSLDAIIARHGMPAYIKVDCEGYEIEVLKGLSRAPRVLSVEYLPAFPGLTYAVIERIEALGTYQFNAVAGERSGFLWPDWRDGEAVRAWLASLGTDAPSGDLFARLSPQDPRQTPERL